MTSPKEAYERYEAVMRVAYPEDYSSASTEPWESLNEPERQAWREAVGEVPDRRERAACPCLHTTPCDPRCTCVMPASSSGCRRCCSYGSTEQQRVKAERLVRSVPSHEVREL